MAANLPGTVGALMPLVGSISIDLANSTSTLIYTFNGTDISEFAFALNRVIAPRRTQSLTIPEAEFRDGFRQIGRFIDQVTRQLSPVTTPTTAFIRHVEKSANTLEMTGTIGGVDIAAEWKQSTKECEFQPREALDLRWSDFRNFISFNGHFLDEIAKF